MFRVRHLLAAAVPRGGLVEIGLFAGLAAPVAASGQGVPLSEGLPTLRRAPRLSPSIILDNRDSFVQASAVRIIGLNVGVVPRGKPYRLGLGAYTLRRSYAQLYTYSGKGKNLKLKDTFSRS